MLESSLIFTLLRSVPECILLILASLRILEIKLEVKKIVSTILIFTCIVIFIRMLPISFGIHTILCLLAQFILLGYIHNESKINLILGVIKIYACLAISEFIYVSILNLFRIDVTKLLDNTSATSALITLPSLIIFIGIVYLINPTKKDRIKQKG